MTTYDQKTRNRTFHTYFIAIIMIACLSAFVFAGQPARSRSDSKSATETKESSRQQRSAQTKTAATARQTSQAQPKTSAARSQATAKTTASARSTAGRSTATAQPTRSTSTAKTATVSRSQPVTTRSSSRSSAVATPATNSTRTTRTFSQPKTHTVSVVSTAKMDRRSTTASSSNRSTVTITPGQSTTTRQPSVSVTQSTTSRPQSSVTAARSTSAARKPVTTITRPATQRNPVASTTRSVTTTPGTVTRTTTTTSPSGRTSVSKTVTTPTRDVSWRKSSAVTKTITRSNPIRVTDIKTKPDRVIVEPARTIKQRSAAPSRSSVSVSISDNSVSLSSSRAKGRPAHQPVARQAPAKIVINNNTHVHVQGKQSHDRPRPYVPRRLYTTKHYVSYDPYWYDHGSYFSFRWSSSSCGLALYLPFSSTYYRNSYYYRNRPKNCYGISYYYPRYHRKYVFVSLGGYWPHDYRYRRYYWYGCHPHYWYGPRVVQPANYTTINYYNNTGMTSGLYGYSSTSKVYNTISSPATEIIDEPQYETVADLTFAHAVVLFEAGRYDDAAAQFREAVLLSPDDVVVPFTYAQALFAAGEYAKAASVLRGGLEMIPDDELTIYYPRGLYEDDQTLADQIEALHQALAGEPFAADYQLLLGYQYLGMGQLDKALVYLPRAAADIANRPAAEKLTALAEQLKEETN